MFQENVSLFRHILSIDDGFLDPKCVNKSVWSKESAKRLQYSKLSCSKCNSSELDDVGRYTYRPNTPSRVRCQRVSKRDISFEPLATTCNMFGPKSVGESGCNGHFNGEHEVFQEGIAFNEYSLERHSGESRESQSLEYVKRTAQLFEKANNSNRKSPGASSRSSPEKNYTHAFGGSNGTTYMTEIRIDVSEPRGDSSAENGINDSQKKPSYLGVSCSNSGYRNVINYDSKLREGFRSPRSQRESLVLSNSRLRDSSPFKYEPGAQNNSSNMVKLASLDVVDHSRVNGLNQTKTDKFVNISTSTKTISTFRKDVESMPFDSKPQNSKSGETISLDSIFNNNNNSSSNNNNHHHNNNNHNNNINNKSSRSTGSNNNDNDNRSRISSFRCSDFDFKSCKSPEKNCNSFLKSINSFEKNCMNSQFEKMSNTKIDGDLLFSRSSIQQRIERLYGPAALAQGFYVQKPQTRESLNRDEENSRVMESVPQSIKSSIESIPDLLPAAPEVVLPIDHCATPTADESFTEITETTEKNGHYFLKLLRREIDRLDELATFAERELENGENLPEEASGKLRAAAGKARLLIRQKLHQFEGLCQKNLNEKPGEKFPTTSEDLAGFWDMVMLQVVQVYTVFEDIHQLKKNNWSVTSPKTEKTTAAKVQPNTSKKIVKKTSTSNSNSTTSSEKSEAMKKAREENRRKMMEERRKQMKELKENKNINNDSEIEIYAK